MTIQHLTKLTDERRVAGLWIDAEMEAGKGDGVLTRVTLTSNGMNGFFGSFQRGRLVITTYGEHERAALAEAFEFAAEALRESLDAHTP